MIDNRSGQLYLSKDIHVDSYGLAQHQIDAIRFMFKQFQLFPWVCTSHGSYPMINQIPCDLSSLSTIYNTHRMRKSYYHKDDQHHKTMKDISVSIFHRKIFHSCDVQLSLITLLKKLGVIVNDPPGYGKTIEVVLFLNAIKTSLRKSILVLCDENATAKWKKYFLDKTDLLNGGGVKTKVTIGTTSDLAEHKRTEWSVLVVDADTVDWQLITNNKNRNSFNVDYKIWITAEDMKCNLEIFSKIYHWMSPKRMFDSEMFTPKTNNAMDIVSKAIRLDTFFQDIVIRGRNYVSPETSKTNIVKTLKLKPTLKNKDNTGTKIKRSKRKINIDNTTTDADNANECSALKITKDDVSSEKNKEISEHFYKQPVLKAVEVSNQKGEECTKSDVARRDCKDSNIDKEFADSIMMLQEENEISSKLDDVSNDKFEQRLKKNNELEDPKTAKKNKCNATDDFNGNSKPRAINVQKVIEDTIDYKVSKESADHLNMNISRKVEVNRHSVNDNNSVMKETEGKLSNNKPSDDVESKLEKLGAEMLKKYKGTLLDSLF